MGGGGLSAYDDFYAKSSIGPTTLIVQGVGIQLTQESYFSRPIDDLSLEPNARKSQCVGSFHLNLNNTEILRVDDFVARNYA